MTGQLTTRVMKARRPSECPRWGRYIRVGDQIGLCGVWLCIRCIVDRLDEHHLDDQ